MPTLDFEERVESTMNLIEASDEIHLHNNDGIAEFNRDLKLEEKTTMLLSKS